MEKIFSLKNERNDIMKIRGIAAIALSAVLMFSGCGAKKTSDTENAEYSADSNLNPLGELPICKEKVTLKLLIGQNASVTDYKENSYTKKIEEYGNVDLEFEVVPSADISTKLNLMMNSGSGLPDVIISGLTPALSATYGENGMLIPLNKYYENSSYYIKKALKKEGKNGDKIMNYLTAPDGNIYTGFNYTPTLQNEFTNVIWIYKPWLDELGMKVPETLEEYRAALQAFKDNDLNHNGKADEIPLIDYSNQNAVNTIMNTLIYFEPTSDMLSVKNGKLSYAYTSDEWKKGVEYLSDLCKNDLFSSVSFSSDQAQFKSVLANEENRVGSFVWTTPSAIPAASPRRAEFVPVFLRGKDKLVSATYRPPYPSFYYAVTKECKNPEAAFRIADLLCKEDLSIWSGWGQEGVDWVKPEKGEKALYDFMGYKPLIKPIMEVGTTHAAHWGLNLGYRGYEVAGGIVSSDDVARVAKAEAMKTLVNYIPEETVNLIIFTNDELEEYTEIITNANNYYQEKTTKFITGYENIDKEWDKYVAELENNIGLGRALEIAQKAYDRTNADK